MSVSAFAFPAAATWLTTPAAATTANAWACWRVTASIFRGWWKEATWWWKADPMPETTGCICWLLWWFEDMVVGNKRVFEFVVWIPWIEDEGGRKEWRVEDRFKELEEELESFNPVSFESSSSSNRWWRWWFCLMDKSSCFIKVLLWLLLLWPSLEATEFPVTETIFIKLLWRCCWDCVPCPVEETGIRVKSTPSGLQLKTILTTWPQHGQQEWRSFQSRGKDWQALSSIRVH